MTEVENKVDEQEAKLDEAFGRLEKEDDHKEDTRPAGNKREASAGSIFAIFLSLVALGFAAYSLYFVMLTQNDEAGIRIDTELERLQQEAQVNGRVIADMTRKMEQLSLVRTKEIEVIKGELDTERQSQESLMEDLQSRINDIDNNSGTVSSDWLLAEVDYLLRMANQRVFMERDPGGALSMLKAADNIISSAQGLTAFPLRQAIAADIAELEAVNLLDKEGIYLRLSALAGKVDELRQKELNYSSTFIDSSESTEASIGMLDRLLAFISKAGKRLASLVDFRRDEMEITRILPPEETYYLRQNLILKLEMSQIALLANNAAVYNTSLNEADAWVRKYFDPELRSTIVMLEGLEGLREIKVEQKLPNVTASLREIRGLMASFHEASKKS